MLRLILALFIAGSGMAAAQEAPDSTVEAMDDPALLPVPAPVAPPAAPFAAPFVHPRQVAANTSTSWSTGAYAYDGAGNIAVPYQ